MSAWAGFAFIIAVAILIGALSLETATLARDAASTAKAGFGGGFFEIIGAIPFAAAWLVLLCTPVVGVLLAFLAVEWAMVGRPRSLRYTGFCLLVQVGLVLLYYFASPYLQLVLPTGGEAYIQMRSQDFPTVLQPAVDIAVVVAMYSVIGLGGYWVHRAQHEIPLLWRFHAVHHSIEDMEAARDVSHPLDAIGDRIAVILTGIFLGFEYQSFAVMLAFLAIRGRLLHSRAPINFGLLGGIFVDNRFHFAHHSVRPKYFDKNYGGFITLYDRLFGTYVAPDGNVLESTGMPSKLPPRNAFQFLTGSLTDRPQH